MINLWGGGHLTVTDQPSGAYPAMLTIEQPATADNHAPEFRLGVALSLDDLDRLILECEITRRTILDGRS